jgi:ATP-dependent helicase/nuclease subunit B
LLGPAGSGKTFRCLTQIRSALASSPEGPPLILLAPKQSTYQLERALLSTGELMGYTRLHVLSFERLAEMVFERLKIEMPELLSPEARLMVLRSILSRRRADLKLFRASSRLTGFADELATLLDELQRHEATPESLKAAAEAIKEPALALKMHDIAILFADYTQWLEEHQLQDANLLLTAAAARLNEAACDPLFAEIWADGFADLSLQEAAFLAAVARHAGKVTATFCIGEPQNGLMPWMSNWASPKRSMERCEKAFANAALARPVMERIEEPNGSRFKSDEVLAHVERFWGAARPYSGRAPVSKFLRVINCPDPEGEIREGAREIRRFVRNGGRLRDVVVLGRRMDPYLPFIKRIFPQFEIPIFIDRREDISHHPLAELTRSALRSVALGWRPEDWFTALKTGLVPASEQEIDRLENEALARGWRGDVWEDPHLGEEPALDWIPPLLGRLMPPFTQFRIELKKRSKGISGAELAAAIRGLWERLRVEDKLQRWAEAKEEGVVSGEAHLTVWGQVNDWLGDVEIAFGKERLGLREWLPILEAGLSKLSVGIIPPSLDQVLIGSIERSRNCEAELVILMGLNEGIFPAPREQSALLTDAERSALNDLDVTPAESARSQMSREQHLGYLAFTRASKRLVVTFSSFDSQGGVLNPSAFLSQLSRLFPDLVIETPPLAEDWRQAEHAHELIACALPGLTPSSDRPMGPAADFSAMPGELLKLKRVADVLKAVEALTEKAEGPQLSRSMALKLYGTTLKTSVSRMEQFAACPFKFFVNSGLDAKERTTFELDAREKGSFQHEVLSEFHERLRSDGKRWRDVSTAEARELVGKIVDEQAVAYRDGLLRTSEQTRFTALLIREALQDFVQTLVEWMHSQNLFDPVAAELPFGEDKECPAWVLNLGDGLKLSLHGRIDRVDLYRPEGSDGAYCMVTDYKSSTKKLNDVMVQNGLQLQLLSYLNVLKHWPDPGKIGGQAALIPAGVFYVNLKGSWPGASNREASIEGAIEARKAAYRHTGRFDKTVLKFLDSRDTKRGDQFAFSINQDKTISRSCKEPLDPEGFRALLDLVERNLIGMGRRVLDGEAEIAPYRKGSETPCTHCEYMPICRSDPWTQIFRSLKEPEEEEES